MARGQRRAKKKRRRMSIKFGPNYDYNLMIIVLALVVFGLIMIFSTSYYSAVQVKGDSMYYIKRQGYLAFAGLVIMFIGSFIDYKIFLVRLKVFPISLPTLMLLGSIGLQIMVLLVGDEYNGAKRWIKIGPLGTFQPSDFAKVAAIVYVAYMIHLSPRLLDNFVGFLRIAAPVMVDVALIAVENVSTAIVMTLIVGGMCFVASRKKGYFFAVGGLGVVALVLIFCFGESFRMARVQSWLNVETDANAFQTRQGLYAIASGGWLGRGLGQSTQKLGYVPEAQNDWIFSIICEELGIVGACCVIMTFVLLLWRILKNATEARELMGGMLCVGVMIHVAAQVLINVAVVTNAIPSTGVALPFISYGGTSVAMMLIEMSLVMSVSNRSARKYE